MDTESNLKQVKAFKRFLSLLPHGKDQELVLLKGHLLIEEQVHQIIQERLINPDALKDARIECHMAICLAQSFFPADDKPWLWDSLIKLNKIRNKIAHNVEYTGLKDSIEDFINSYPSGLSDIDDRSDAFELTLWSMFSAVARLVETPSAKVLQLVNSDEK